MLYAATEPTTDTERGLIWGTSVNSTWLLKLVDTLAGGVYML